MPPDTFDAARLDDMRRAVESLMRFVAGKNRQSLDADEILRSAVERQAEIIGEAARHVSSAFQTAHPEIPWKKIMGTRHILAHDYGTVNYDILWRIATEHAPALLAQILAVLPDPPPDPLPEA